MPGPDDDDDPLRKLQRMMIEATGESNKVVPLAPKLAERDRKKAPTRGEDRDKGKRFKELPTECPVRPLGIQDSTYYFLDVKDQLIVKPADKMNQKGVDDLFKSNDGQRWAEQNYSRFSQYGNIVGIDRDRLSRALMGACGELGVFDPSGRVRGAGGWKNELGHLVFHAGNAVLTADHSGKLYEQRPGVHDHHIYPASTDQLRPSEGKVDHKAAEELLTLLKSWNWKRGELDALLMLGWIVLAPIAGALRWRPAIWITGDMATGKSTLQELIRNTQGGRRGMIQAADATGAGIWQALKFRSLPVGLDEVEADTNNDKRQSIITLMRISASGDMLVRGGADHVGREFNAYSPFMFSSINMLPLAPQDISRLCLLELQPLARNSARPRLDPVRLARIGADLRRRVIMAWPRWEEILQPWSEPIEREFTRRTGDTFGFLLAMADLALYAPKNQPAHADKVEETIAPLLPSLREWRAVAGTDAELMLSHLGTWELEPWDKGRKITVRQIVYWASDRGATPPRDADDEAERYGKAVTRVMASEALRRHGLAVINGRGDHAGEVLAIAFRHSALRRIFRGTKWQDGVWRQSATRVAGAEQRKLRFEGTPEAAVFIPIAVVLGDDAAELGESDTPATQ